MPLPTPPIPTPGGAARSVVRRVTNPTGEPQRAYLWEWEIVGLSGALKHEDVSFYTRSIQLPQRSVQRIQSEYLGMRLSYPANDDSDKTLTANIWDDERMTSLRFFEGWINHTNTPNIGASATKEKYTADIKLYLKNSFDLFTVLKVEMKNAFPYQRSEADLSYEDNQLFQYSVSFSYDFLYLNDQDYEDVGGGDGGGLLEQVTDSLGF